MSDQETTNLDKSKSSSENNNYLYKDSLVVSSNEVSGAQDIHVVTTMPRRKPHTLLLIASVALALIAAAFFYLFFGLSSSNNNNNRIVSISHLSIGITSNNDLGALLYPKAPDTNGATFINAQIFDGLVQYENQDQIVPDLASSWTRTSDNTWIFTIKSEIKFHDGHTLTPNDVAYSINNLISLNNEYAQTFTNFIKSASVVGPNEVEINTVQPDPILLNQLAFIYIIDSNLPKGAEPSLAGTGAYEIKPGTKPTNQEIQLVAYSHFHGGKVYTKSATLYSVKNTNQLLNGFKINKYNIIGEVPASTLQQAGSYKYIEQDNTVSFLAFNTLDPVSGNKLIREAMRYAINATAINQLAGYKVNPISQVIPPTISGYDPAITAYKQDIALAKSLVIQAGYPNGVNINLETSDEDNNVKTLAAELKVVGINATINYQNNFNNFIADFLGGKSQMFYLAYSSNTLDGVDIMESVISSSNYNNDTFNNIVSQASTTLDQGQRTQLLQQASQIINTDIPLVPISYQDNLWLMDNNYVVHQDLQSSYLSAYLYKVYQK